MPPIQGKFRPKNPEKYQGDASNIIFRSSWERTVMNYLDLREEVQAWQSEEKCVWYYDPITKKKRRYFPDFIIKLKNSKGEIIVEMIEVKPKRQIQGPPENPKRKTKAWVKSVQTYITNMSKWEAAEEYCKERGWKFRLMSEDNIYGK